jgi:hypothetical protein
MNLQAFHQENLFDATHRLFAQLGIRLNSNTKQSLSIRDVLNTHYKENPIFRAVEETYFSGVIDHSIFKQNANNSYQDAIKKADQTYEGLLLFSLKLNRYPTRTEIAELVRAFNRISQKMPVALLLCYSNSHDHYISLGLPERFKYLQDWRQGEKIGKVIILRDIHTQHPHAGHLRILNNLSIQGKNIQNFNDLHEHWLTILDLKILNKTFYNELANWFYWAMDKVEFPDDAEKNTEKRNAENLIRLITRFIFVWFMKEKKLVPQELFDKTYIDQLLNDKDKTHSTYYKAILQNLFFATLNTPMKKDDPKSRIFIDDAKKYGYKNDGYLQQGFYRYSRFIKDKEKFLKLFEQVPFLNGGLFDCLDTHDGKKEIRIDGFSDNPKNEERLKIPDELFFTEEELTVDLSNYLENGKNKTVTGLIPLLNKYIFTVAENTPIEEDVALDPELLGNVFENLLGAYLPESASTARKASGSYYTPKEIVSYMVDESLTSYFQTYFNRNDEPFLQNLRTLLSYDSNHNPFQDQPKLTEKFIEAIETVKILDPACGSGAFPMAILNKLTHLLHKLDPENKVWKKKLLEKIPPDIRSEAEKSFENKSLDYIRKLGLIENCIYGVDIQTIAIQISKLRFFLSLLIEQTIDDSKPNRDIRALPNLETKFVAANTLIALNSGSRGLAHTEKVEQLEEKLFTLREELFYANSRQEKLKLQKQEKETRERLKQALRTANFPPDTANKIADWDPFNQNQSADWFDPEWMFGIKDGFDIVIGNPPYVSTKGVAEEDKKILKEQFGFADDLYSHFYFKGIELLKLNSILAYISSKTFWTIQTKKNLRELLLENRLLQIVDTANPFEAAMVDTCITIVQKKPCENNTIQFIDAKRGWDNKQCYVENADTYKNSVNHVFFIPTPFNLKVYEKLGKTVEILIDQWWDKISTSKKIEKYKTKLKKYRQSLKPGDITLLGLITEGGQGLATANNGKYIGVLENTKYAKKVIKERPEKLWKLIESKEPPELSHLRTKNEVARYLSGLSENDIRKLFDGLKERYGRDIFGKGWLYRIVSKNEIADVETLTDEKKLNGIAGEKTFVPYDKGDKDGNRWYAPTPYYIDWSRENVNVLQTDTKARWQGYQFYFREGFCWTFTLNEYSEYFKARIKEKGVFDVNAMSLFPIIKNVSEKYLISLINSHFIFYFKRLFINNTSGFQINDARQLPIVIPTQEELKEFEAIFDRALAVQKQKFVGQISEKKAEEKLDEIQKELDEKVLDLYGLLEK